jgi:hypothetical protein
MSPPFPLGTAPVLGPAPVLAPPLDVAPLPSTLLSVPAGEHENASNPTSTLLAMERPKRTELGTLFMVASAVGYTLPTNNVYLRNHSILSTFRWAANNQARTVQQSAYQRRVP